MGNGIGGHHSPVMGKDEWITPLWIIRALPVFDLDPCAAINQPWMTAIRTLTSHDDGLAQEWKGSVWLNPPYGRSTGAWLDRLADHGNGVALIFARTETEMFFKSVWAKASALLFIKGRLTFHHLSGEPADHNSGAPSVLVAYGQERAAHLMMAASSGAIPGQFVLLRSDL